MGINVEGIVAAGVVEGEIDEVAVDGRGVIAGTGGDVDRSHVLDGVVDRGGAEAGDGAGGAIIRDRGGAAGGVLGIIEGEGGLGVGISDVDGAVETLHADTGESAKVNGIEVLYAGDIESAISGGENVDDVGAEGIVGVDGGGSEFGGLVDVESIDAAAAV